jgi:N-methylhydantoinase B
MDPIGFELFKNAIFSIADEMALTVFRLGAHGDAVDHAARLDRGIFP